MLDIQLKQRVCKNCEVIESANLIDSAKEILKKNSIKSITFDPNDFTF